MFKNYICPKTGDDLSIVTTNKQNFLKNESLEYEVKNDIPNLTYPNVLPDSDSKSKSWYDENADVYDELIPLTFDTFGVNELEVRKKMITELNIEGHHKILETGSGTGRDSLLMGELLDEQGELHLTDISLPILEKAVSKFKHTDYKTYFTLVNASYLPYPDNYFDCYYHFGGFNTFDDKKRAFAEISRVVKVGGKVVVGDESMPPWYRDTEFGKVLMNSNPHYCYELPLNDMHSSARDVKVEWIIGGVFYYITYTVGEGAPHADIDFEIPGIRGGTHRTRYYGHMEGVSPEAITLATKAREKSGESMHKWLDNAVKTAALKELG
jgi:ubiquinone/menaquinone biosynthesis C-methylase UbiE